MPVCVPTGDLGELDRGRRIEADGAEHVRILLKAKWQDGTTSVVIPRQDLVLRMAAQVPLPRRASLRYHGVFAPNASLRPFVVPAGNKARCRREHASDKGLQSPRETSTRMTYSEALKRAFSIDILQCECGGRRIVLAAVQDPVSLERILRQVGLWPDPADVESIRGPPEDLWPVELDAGADVDAPDGLMPADWAA